MIIETPLIKLVYNILNDDVEARDSWLLTMQKVYDAQMLFHGIKKVDFYTAFFEQNSLLTNCQTIVRFWRKIQEDYPELRGELWEYRQKQGGQYVSDHLNSQMSLFSKDELHELASLKPIEKNNHIEKGNAFSDKMKNFYVIIEVDDSKQNLEVRMCSNLSEINLSSPLIPMTTEWFSYNIENGNYTFDKKVLLD